MSQLMRNILVWLAISGITFVAIQNIYNQSPSQNMNYSEFVSLVNKDQISQVSFKGDGYTIEGVTQEGNSFTTTRPIYVQDDQLMTDLFEHRVEVLGEEPQRESIWTQLLVASFPILIILAIFFFFHASNARRHGRSWWPNVIWQKQSKNVGRREGQNNI